MIRRYLMALAIAAVALPLVATAALAGPREDILAGYAKEAAQPFDAARGEALYRTEFTGGKPDTPSCVSCHEADPAKAGRTRAGKVIEPMAVSVTPDRFTDAAKVEKWFRRNCDSVLGRACTAQEKGDFITFMASR